MIKKTINIRKAYIAPQLIFEELEQDTRETLMAGSPDSGTGGGTEGGGGDEEDEFSLRDLEFEPADPADDFFIND